MAITAAMENPQATEATDRQNEQPPTLAATQPFRHILGLDCNFNPHIFVQISLNLIKNPNINSSHLFRADILYDSDGAPNPATELSPETVARLLEEYPIEKHAFPGYNVWRSIIRRLIPRNPQLDKPLLQ
jgi:tRNASer (uridine44-2'-O)-methyltransferase